MDKNSSELITSLNFWENKIEITSNIDFDYKTYTNENLIKFENAMKEI
tara:strand:- start:25 stop:168 length:144 start_codon:yes stop_codon:yes gene_type:complete